jgi:hypothetical protein
METRQIVARIAGIALIAGALVGAGTRLQATEQSEKMAAKAQIRSIEGVWLPIVSITDCDTQAVLFTFPSMETYVRGGGFIAFGAVQKSDQIGLGAWRHVRGREFVAEYQFFNYNPPPGGAPDGSPDGTILKVSARIRLNAAGTAFTSYTEARILDYSGNVLGDKICGTRQATRLQ